MTSETVTCCGPCIAARAVADITGATLVARLFQSFWQPGPQCPRPLPNPKTRDR